MYLNGYNFTLGADPELFLANKDGKPIAAHDAGVEGTKSNPKPIGRVGGKIQRDGTAIEFNIAASETKEYFRRNILSVMDSIKKKLKDYTFLECVSLEWEPEYFASFPLEAVLLGCDPDFDAYGMCENIPPDRNSTMRTAGGHVHIGGFYDYDGYYADGKTSQGHMVTCSKFIKLMDESVGVYSLLWDHDDKRREMYGKAGAFRPKHYGVEYRTMSNAWIFKPELIDFVWDGTMNAINKMFVDDYEPNPDIQKIINNSDRKASFFENNKYAERVLAMVA